MITTKNNTTKPKEPFSKTSNIFTN